MFYRTIIELACSWRITNGYRLMRGILLVEIHLDTSVVTLSTTLVLLRCFVEGHPFAHIFLPIIATPL